MSLVKGFTNSELGGKIDNEGLDYFFRGYLSPDSILDPDLRAAVDRFNAAMDDIEAILDEAGVFDETDDDGEEVWED